MELNWKLTLEGSDEGEDDDLKLTFVDTSNILGEPKIERQFIDTIIKNTKKYDHYSIFRNLKKIISDKNEDMTGLAIWALLGIVKEKSQRVGLLLGSLAEGGVHIIAAWPSSFTDQLRADVSLLDVVLDKFISDPSFWTQVDLVIGFH
ncbi:MAG: hypothetical protein OEY49_03400 [Candidatus Heimdallarchaeota archaeon]|nr:hypothetical protein [Candidatus Heimdallarchaeota archaeon]